MVLLSEWSKESDCESECYNMDNGIPKCDSDDIRISLTFRKIK